MNGLGAIDTLFDFETRRGPRERELLYPSFGSRSY